MVMEKQVQIIYPVGHVSTKNSTRKHLHGKMILKAKVLNYISTTPSNFPWPQNFSAFLSNDKLQIN